MRLALLCLALLACGDDSAPADASADATRDTATGGDTGTDTGTDSAIDTGVDAAGDAAEDVRPDVLVTDAETPDGGCGMDEECGEPNCRQMGRLCLQSRPTCTRGVCENIALSIPMASCNLVTGICDSTGPGEGCRTNCDCTQGQLCVTGAEGMCVTGIIPAYCCELPGCPSGEMCQNRDGTRDTCR